MSVTAFVHYYIFDLSRNCFERPDNDGSCGWRRHRHWTEPIYGIGPPDVL